MGKEKEIWGKYKHFRYPMKFLICSFILTFLYIIITLGIRMSSNVSISFDRNETLSNLNKLHDSNDLQRTCGLFILLASMSKNFVFTCGSIHLIFTKFDLFFFVSVRCHFYLKWRTDPTTDDTNSLKFNDWMASK